MNLLAVLVFSVVTINQARSAGVWKWECENQKCIKKEIKGNESVLMGLESCRLVCSEEASLWPKPNGALTFSKTLIPVNVDKLEIIKARDNSDGRQLANRAFDIFKNDITSRTGPKARKAQDKAPLPLQVNIDIKDKDADELTLKTDESYKLDITTSPDSVVVNIEAETWFGSRHALETLGQLVVYDDVIDELVVPDQVHIEDKPGFPYRGVHLDTARNYISVDVIKKTINAMAASKLNTFHWHITDSHSFPYVTKSKNTLQLSQYGAYSPRKVYTPENIADILEFAKVRGVRVIPELDAPAHVGEGWQKTGFVVCFNHQPWTEQCVEPPCGQLDPTQEKLYDFLEEIYADMMDQFKPVIFHMGGDEVNFNCWNATLPIVTAMKARNISTTEAGFVDLWSDFQEKSLQRVYKTAGKELDVILWTSTLTEGDYIKNLPKDKYIIQVWTQGDDPHIRSMLEKGYRLILSNVEALYLDCGFSGWVTDGNNWCSPYVGWQKVYENAPSKIAGDKVDQILGNEAILWTEQVDSTAVDSRLWPRAAAMAETLWSVPKTGWRAAESRFLIHRERLVNKGIDADGVEPEWCHQNEKNCPI